LASPASLMRAPARTGSPHRGVVVRLQSLRAPPFDAPSLKGANK
jgi:hypothetical protein